MIFAILFVMVFLIGAVTYHFTSNWWHGVAIASVLYCLNTLWDTSAHDYWVVSLVLGLPIVFVGALLGAYIVEQRRPQEEPLIDGAENPEASEAANEVDTVSQSSKIF